MSRPQFGRDAICYRCRGKGCHRCDFTGIEGGPVLDIDAARRRREEAIERVSASADPDWSRVAFEAVVEVARRRARFTTDAPVALLEHRGIGQPPEPRAWAAVMRRVERARVAVLTAEYAPSANKRSHGRPKRIWRSLVVATGES